MQVLVPEMGIRAATIARSGALLLAAAVLAGCAAVPRAERDPQTDYFAAIADAAVASPAKIKALLPLPPGASIAMISWVSAPRAPCAADAVPCTLTVGADPLWVTLAGEVQALCRSWNLRGDPLRRRLEQLLGLPLDPPPQYRKTKFLVLNVPRERIERPCLGVNETDAAHPRCTLNALAATPADLRDFVGRQMAGSYVIDNPAGPGYPYTRLGYTYDWGTAAKADGHYGASEFLVMPHTGTQVAAQIATDDYCQ